MSFKKLSSIDIVKRSKLRDKYKQRPWLITDQLSHIAANYLLIASNRNLACVPVSQIERSYPQQIQSHNSKTFSKLDSRETLKMEAHVDLFSGSNKLRLTIPVTTISLL